MTEKWPRVSAVSEGRKKPEKEQSSSATEEAKLASSWALWCPPGCLWALTTNQARIPWNAPAFPMGLLSPAGCRPLLPKGLRSDPSWARPVQTQGSPGVPPFPGSSGNPGASCCLDCRAKNLPPGSRPQRPQVLTFKLRDCQHSLTTAIFLKEEEEER